MPAKRSNSEQLSDRQDLIVIENFSQLPYFTEE